MHGACAAGQYFKSARRSRWWGRTPGKPSGENEEEIDIVALNSASKEILFGECKWRNAKVDTDVYASLKNKAAIVDWNMKHRKEHFAIFSKSGFTDRMAELAKEEKVCLFDLNALKKLSM